MTVFAALTVALVISVMCAFLEVARYHAMEGLLDMTSEAYTESIFAAYVRPLWNQYHMLGFAITDMDGDISFQKQENRIMNYDEKRRDIKGLKKFDSLDLYRARLKTMCFEEYDLLTDQDGRLYEEAVASMVKQMTGLDWMDNFLQDYDLISDNLMSEEDISYISEQAVDALKTEYENNNSAENSEKWNKNQAIKDTPMEEEQEIKKVGILSLVVEHPEEISSKSIYGKNLPSNRNLYVGTGMAEKVKEDKQSPFHNKLLMDLYHSRIFSNYIQSMEDENTKLGQGKESKDNTDSINAYGKVLDYELEYLLYGEDNDRDNLKKTVKAFFAMREALNYTYLQGDQAKKAEALALAELIGGASMNPVLIEALKQGILLSWASVESILDVRAILQGKRIAIMKNADQWTSSLSGLKEYKEGFLAAKECANGIDYKSYLTCLLLLKSRSDTAFRAMDLEECNIRSLPGYETFRMDQVVVQAKITYQYDFNPICSSLVKIGPNYEKDSYSYENQVEYAYAGKK